MLKTKNVTIKANKIMAWKLCNDINNNIVNKEVGYHCKDQYSGMGVTEDSIKHRT